MHTLLPAAGCSDHLSPLPLHCHLLLQYDSVHGRYEGSVEDTKEGITIDGHKIKVFSQM